MVRQKEQYFNLGTRGLGTVTQLTIVSNESHVIIAHFTTPYGPYVTRKDFGGSMLWYSEIRLRVHRVPCTHASSWYVRIRSDSTTFLLAVSLLF